MMRKFLKNKTGITMVSLAIVVIAILILTGVIIYNVSDSLGINRLKGMQNDIQNIRDKVNNYYATYGVIPAKIKYINTSKLDEMTYSDSNKYGVINKNIDIGDFYIVDLAELENLTLNYGEDYKHITDSISEDEASQYEDIYIINETSQNVFYVAGIKVDEDYFYTDYTSDDVDKVAVNLRYFDGVKIPDGYYFNSGNSADNLTIKNKNDETKIYSWIVVNTDIQDIPSDVVIEDDKKTEFIDSVNTFNGYYINEQDNSVIYIVNEEKWSPVYDETAEYKDKNGDVATIPAGFKVSEKYGQNTILDGLVVQDSDGSEFVWIPVDDVNEMATLTSGEDEDGNPNYQGKLYDFTSTGMTELKDYGVETTSYREPDVLDNNTYDSNDEYLAIIIENLSDSASAADYENMNAFKNTMQKDYNAMIKSIETYHGFYVGRYEMSKSDNDTALSKANSIALTEDVSSANTWYGLYSYGKTYVNRNNDSSVESSMIWGSQWDAMLRWIQKSDIDVTDSSVPNGGRKNMDLTLTGPEGDTDIVKNIYDLYGGRNEWTLEAWSEVYRVYRGGGIYNSFSLSNRAINNPDYMNEKPATSSRLTLYIN